MAYDAYLFSTRYDAMTILLNIAKAKKQIKAESLEKLFGTKNSIFPAEYIIKYRLNLPIIQITLRAAN